MIQTIMVKSKYDTVEEKYNFVPMAKKAADPLGTYKFHLNSDFEGRPKQRNKYEIPRRFRATPDSLVELSVIVIDKFKLPPAFYWTAYCVQKFIRNLGFPQYVNAFAENMINGRKLLTVDASALAAMNIKDFDDIKTITKAIRELFKIEFIRYNRSISLPPRFPLTHYKFYRVLTGPKYELCRPSELFRKMKLIRDAPRNESHWIRLENWLKHYPDYQMERVGYAPRYNLYGTGRPLLRKLTIQEHNKILCSCVPPCQCEWSENEMREPWILKYIVEINQIPVEPGDLLAISDHTEIRKGNLIYFEKRDECICFHECSCLHRSDSVLTVLKDKMPRKYDTHINRTK